MSIIVDAFKMLWKFLICLKQGEAKLINDLANMLVAHPKFFALYVEISLVLLIFMWHMLRKRKEQREAPVDPPKISVAPITPPPCPPDTTLRDAVVRILAVVVIILLVLSRGE